jgi:hypothetical protein
MKNSSEVAVAESKQPERLACPRRRSRDMRDDGAKIAATVNAMARSR